ncbi:beta strand repeat-containing protein [Flavobacterium panacagri]|uniref:beta strand repeat-containing protein n=1 Tax=Flavobacterium panacagri TaxID=3034146 RepID=UPI0025A4DE77|nr:hypothetical protein [Flavobacterium panacagri]
MNKYLVILLSLLFPCVLLAQKKGIRVVDNKGTIIYVDPSKWFQVGSNLFNKNTDGNVAIGIDTTNVSINSRLYISNGGSTTLPALKLNTPFDGELTDDLLTWNPSDFSVRKIDITKLSPNDWHLLGNAGTDPATNFLGTIDNQDLSFRTYNTERMRIASSGNIGIGTAAPANTLEINSIAANTSGLRLTNLTSASPADLTGKTIGVNATGDVVVVNGSATTVSNTSVDNSLTTTVNSQTGLPVTIINSNTLTATNGSLISTVNGIATPSVPVLIAADNALTVTNGKVQLGGTLIQPTTINTNSNSFAISNLPVGAPSDRLVAIDPSSGVLKTVTQAMWSTIGNAGTTPGTNFLGTTDSQNLMFKIYNIQAGLLTTSNTSFGYQSLMTGTVGSGITAIGVNALSKGGDVADNTAVGYGALKNLTRTVGNTAIGGSVLGSFTGVLGSGSGYGWNTAVGYLALVGNISSGYNTALGASALNKTTGDSNTAVGFNALQNNTSGSNNIAVGTNALNIATTGNYNVAIGTNTGTGNLIGLTTGSNNILIGGSSSNIINASTQTVSNEMNIGNTLFGTGVNGAAGGTGGKIGINTNAPNATLDVQGSQVVKVTIAAGSYTVKTNDYMLVVPSGSSSVNIITLPSAVANKGRVLLIKISMINASSVTVNTSSTTEKFDGSWPANAIGGPTPAVHGSTSIVLSNASGVNDHITVISDGTSWYVSN